ncbi:MAG TPA: hypothetical protein EYG03_13685 [Planctomycetes bacterium]|nr:hypothetical protein [Fuerstiella sp.]HIK93012.1 hypothetical protein [Planctomycetota bacterium]
MDIEEIARIARNYVADPAEMRLGLDAAWGKIHESFIVSTPNKEFFGARLAWHYENPFETDSSQWMNDFIDVLRTVNQINSQIPFRHEVLLEFSQSHLKQGNVNAVHTALATEIRRFKIWEAAVSGRPLGEDKTPETTADNKVTEHPFGIGCDHTKKLVFRKGKDYASIVALDWKKSEDPWYAFTAMLNAYPDSISSEDAAPGKKPGARRALKSRMNEDLLPFDLIIESGTGWSIQENVSGTWRAVRCRVGRAALLGWVTVGVDL